MSEEFERSLAAARVWELAAAAWLRARGWWILPTYDYSGKDDDKAPRLLGPNGAGLVIPDLLTLSADGSRWVEVKFKTQADLYRKTGEMVTGISLRLWEHYRNVQKETGIPVYIVFLHEKEGEVRAGTLAELEAACSHRYEGDRMGRSGMIFFRYRALRVWRGVWAWLAAKVKQ